MMKTYLVGGAVRDRLLGLPVKENDWVVVGATAADLTSQNYQKVGKDFPVFLHPTTKEEYALARLERKVSPGYAGFIFDSDPNVTLEDDLLRRDLTINAIAQDADGTIIDPYHGQVDLNAKILRHVSPAFIEDPVRILRVARFAARFADLGFTVYPETNELMQQMVANGEVDALVPERVWQEFRKALAEYTVTAFFSVLHNCNALAILFPEFNDKYSLLIKSLTDHQTRSDDPLIRFAAICQLLTIVEINTLCKRLAIPKEYLHYAVLVKNNVELLKNIFDPNTVFKLFERTDAFRRPERWQMFVAIANLLIPDAQQIFIQLNHRLEAARNVDVSELIEKGLKNQALGDAICAARLLAIKNAYDSRKSPNIPVITE